LEAASSQTSRHNTLTFPCCCPGCPGRRRVPGIRPRASSRAPGVGSHPSGPGSQGKRLAAEPRGFLPGQPRQFHGFATVRIRGNPDGAWVRAQSHSTWGPAALSSRSRRFPPAAKSPRSAGGRPSGSLRRRDHPPLVAGHHDVQEVRRSRSRCCAGPSASLCRGAPRASHAAARRPGVLDRVQPGARGGRGRGAGDGARQPGAGRAGHIPLGMPRPSRLLTPQLAPPATCWPRRHWNEGQRDGGEQAASGPWAATGTGGTFD